MQSLIKNALALSALALGVTLWRMWFDPLSGSWNEYVKAETGLFAMSLGYTAALAGWAYSLHAASRGSRRGFVVAFVLNGFVWFGIPVLTSAFYCPGICAKASVTFNIVNLASLVLGLLALVAMLPGLRSKGTVTKNLG